MNEHIIINADDLGITPGTNKAIFFGYDNGYINSASLMTNCDYFNEAVPQIKKRKNLRVGVHLNLTYGKSLNHSLYYNNSQGIFNLSYWRLIMKSYFDKSFLREMKKEFELQIERAIDLHTQLDYENASRRTMATCSNSSGRNRILCQNY